jgi:hypothetical protein
MQPQQPDAQKKAGLSSTRNILIACASVALILLIILAFVWYDAYTARPIFVPAPTPTVTSSIGAPASGGGGAAPTGSSTAVPGPVSLPTAASTPQPAPTAAPPPPVSTSAPPPTQAPLLRRPRPRLHHLHGLHEACCLCATRG